MATKGVVCSYQEVIDLHTESDHVTCLGIHTPTGDTPRRMFKGFFDQYKKYRYLGCSMKLVPAARLPADPMHVNTEAGDLIISPRDLMNPILFHGCHGDDLGTILNTLYGTDDVMDSLSALDTQVGSAGDNIKTGFYEILERLYYRALTDNTWKKASVSRGFRKDNLHPLVYSLATNRQIMPGSQGVDPLDIQQNDYLAARQRDPSLDIDPVEGETGVFNYSMKNNLSFLTPRLTSLGWMDTRNVLTSLPENFGVNVNTLVEDLQRPLAEMVNYAELPKLFMGCVLLPPAYLQEQYFRLIINHRFAFKNFRGISFTPMVQAVPAYADANENLFDPEKFTGDDFDSGGSGDTPEPEPTTFTKGFRIYRGTSSYCKFYAIGYKYTTDVTELSTIVYQADESAPTSYGEIITVDLPAGVYVTGTMLTKNIASGDLAYGNIDGLGPDSGTFDKDGVTYTSVASQKLTDTTNTQGFYYA